MPETTRIRIGRHSGDQVDLRIDNDAVSRIHAEAWYELALNMVIVKAAEYTSTSLLFDAASGIGKPAPCKPSR